jgi:hypothetical protein
VYLVLGIGQSRTYSMSVNSFDTHVMIRNDVIYRVFIPDDGKDIKVSCIGIKCVDSTIDGVYSDYYALPELLKERIAVLSILKPDIDVNEVADVGKRINEQTYWVYDL